MMKSIVLLGGAVAWLSNNVSAQRVNPGAMTTMGRRNADERMSVSSVAYSDFHDAWVVHFDNLDSIDDVTSVDVRGEVISLVSSRARCPDANGADCGNQGCCAYFDESGALQGQCIDTATTNCGVHGAYTGTIDPYIDGLVCSAWPGSDAEDSRRTRALQADDSDTDDSEADDDEVLDANHTYENFNFKIRGKSTRYDDGVVMEVYSKPEIAYTTSGRRNADERGGRGRVLNADDSDTDDDEDSFVEFSLVDAEDLVVAMAFKITDKNGEVHYDVATVDQNSYENESESSNKLAASTIGIIAAVGGVVLIGAAAVGAKFYNQRREHAKSSDKPFLEI